MCFLPSTASFAIIPTYKLLHLPLFFPQLPPSTNNISTPQHQNIPATTTTFLNSLLATAILINHSQVSLSRSFLLSQQCGFWLLLSADLTFTSCSLTTIKCIISALSRHCLGVAKYQSILPYTSYSLTIIDCVISALSRSHSSLLKTPLVSALMPYTLSSLVILCLNWCLSCRP